MNAAMIIAHPDDDALFGGPFQRAHRWMNWHVVCVTHDAADGRGRELIEWQAQNGCQRVDFLKFHDEPADLSNGTSSFGPDEVAVRLHQLELKTDLILTHNEVGEYGHPHHVAVGQAVRSLYAGSVPILEFGYSLTETDFQIVVPDFHELALQCYRSQAECILYYYSRDRLCVSANYRWTKEQVGSRDIARANTF